MLKQSSLQTGTIHQPVAHGSQDSLRAQTVLATDRHHPPARRTRVPGFPPCSNSPRYEKGPSRALSLAAELRRRESWDPTEIYGCLEKPSKSRFLSARFRKAIDRAKAEDNHRAMRPGTKQAPQKARQRERHSRARVPDSSPREFRSKKKGPCGPFFLARTV